MPGLFRTFAKSENSVFVTTHGHDLRLGQGRLGVEPRYFLSHIRSAIGHFRTRDRDLQSLGLLPELRDMTVKNESNGGIQVIDRPMCHRFGGWHGFTHALDPIETKVIRLHQTIIGKRKTKPASCLGSCHKEGTVTHGLLLGRNTGTHIAETSAIISIWILTHEIEPIEDMTPGLQTIEDVARKTICQTPEKMIGPEFDDAVSRFNGIHLVQRSFFPGRAREGLPLWPDRPPAP